MDRQARKHHWKEVSVLAKECPEHDIEAPGKAMSSLVSVRNPLSCGEEKERNGDVAIRECMRHGGT